MQLNIIIKNPTTKQVLLSLSGENSLTARTGGFTGGRVVIKGRNNAAIASVAGGINWTTAKAENLLVLPKQEEWAALVAKAAG